MVLSTLEHESHKADADDAGDADLIEVNVGEGVWDLLVVPRPVVEPQGDVEVPGEVLDFEGEWKTKVGSYQVFSPGNLQMIKPFKCLSFLLLLSMNPFLCRVEKSPIRRFISSERNNS